MNKRLCHNKFDATAKPIVAECDECGKVKLCMSFVAEHNAGELYAHRVCTNCLYQAATELRNLL